MLSLFQLPRWAFELVMDYYEDMFVARLRTKYIGLAKRLRGVGRGGYTRPYHESICCWHDHRYQIEIYYTSGEWSLPPGYYPVNNPRIIHKFITYLKLRWW